jgi:stalled ribosome alternative rescue factor ArfA
MSNETWLTISQIAVAFGLGLAALGGLGSHFLRQRIEQAKAARGAYAGKIEAKRKTIFSAAAGVFPKIEFGDSGAMMIYGGDQAKPFISFAKDTQLQIVMDGNQVRVSTLIRSETGQLIAELLNNEWKVNPNQSWGRNYSADALEVKDPSGEIVLQVEALPDRIQLQAKMYDSSGRGFGWGKMIGPDGKVGGALELTGSNHLNLELKIEPIFKYPSEMHLGELIGH